MRVLGTKSTTYSAPRYNSVWPRWRPKPFTSVTVMPETPMSDSAARTSSSLNGLMIAVTSFMCELSIGFRGIIYRQHACYRGGNHFAPFVPRRRTRVNHYSSTDDSPAPIARRTIVARRVEALAHRWCSEGGCP